MNQDSSTRSLLKAKRTLPFLLWFTDMVPLRVSSSATLNSFPIIVSRNLFQNLHHCVIFGHLILKVCGTIYEDAWFIESLEEWRKSSNLSSFILLGHSFGGYVAAKYALKYPKHIQHLILVGTAGFSSETEHRSEQFTKFRSTWKGAIINHLWESNLTPSKVIRLLASTVIAAGWPFCICG
ncbi:hypothetical protein DCAR_0311227 [Daucus carota subsp. sativus]|uniref:AB hydrolase-1 domain-containing protein n=1 Tax=Daucus carota subsp. sativus TaxID=79200 RepID=A0AAF0WMC7_DAUCS|nr:hypothetical protein DCAR_0311227 [Daucus carota subsp. sativus]